MEKLHGLDDKLHGFNEKLNRGEMKTSMVLVINKTV